jgi:hypothetical protein
MAVGVSPTAPANRSIHCLYDARSALVGSLLQASCSQGTTRKIAIWTRASGFPSWEFAM